MSVDVVLSHPWKGKDIGERVTLEDAEAAEVIRDGRGRPATKAAAKAAGVDPEAAASVKK